MWINQYWTGLKCISFIVKPNCMKNLCSLCCSIILTFDHIISPFIVLVLKIVMLNVIMLIVILLNNVMTSVFMLGVVMLNVAMLHVFMLNFAMLGVLHWVFKLSVLECWVLILIVIIMSVITLKCNHAGCHCTECLYSEYCSTDVLNAEGYVEHLYAKCHIWRKT
jgi:hypothetical protein